MQNVWLASSVSIGLALAASIISIRVAISVALIEIIVGAIAGNIIGLEITPWVNFLAGFGAIMLTFLAGTEIDAKVVRNNLGPSVGIGVVSFLAPYLGVLLYARFRHRLVLAGGANRRHLHVHDLGGGRLRGDGRDWVQQDRARQDHPGRVLHHRSRHGAGARHRVCALRRVACPIRCGDSDRPLAAAKVRALVLSTRSGIASASRKPSSSRLFFLSLGGLSQVAGSEAVLPAYLVGMALAPVCMKDPSFRIVSASSHSRSSPRSIS